MNVVGIICEYNPFHLGHLHQMEAARRQAGEDAAVVCVMGGNFVQRGEPALVSKHVRAGMAVSCGADLVLELPVPWALASAERFAAGGVALLDAAGADFLSFGAECPEEKRLSALAEALLSPEYGPLLKGELAAGVSFAAARERAAASLVGRDALLLREPNNILAVEYLKAVALRRSALRPLPVKRSFAAHDGGENGDFAGAARIRELAASGGEYGRFMPDAARALLDRELAAGRTPDPDRVDAMAMYRLRTMTAGEFQALPDAGEGLWSRFMRCAAAQSTLKETLDAVKTKRYAYARLRRMAMAALLGITAGMQQGEPPYLRVLALGERGREVLRQIKRRCPLPVVTKPAAARLLPEEAGRLFRLEARAGDVYALTLKDPAERRGGSEWRTSPVTLAGTGETP